MKNYFRILVAAFMVMAAVACNNEFDEPTLERPTEIALENITISVDGETTRTYIGDDGKTINWCDDDTIAIYDGYALREFTAVEGTIDGKSAQFEGEVATVATTLQAVYPYSAAKVVDGVLHLTAQGEQQLDSHNVADGAILSVAEFEKGAESFRFKNVMGFMRADIEGENVASITVEGLNVAGTVAVTAADATFEVIEGMPAVTLKPAGDTFAPGSYYVALLPGTTPANEFKMSFFLTDGTAYEMVAKKGVNIPRNDGFFVTYSQPTEKFVISDGATLRSFLEKAHELSAEEVVEVTKDIDLTDIELPTAISFAGTLKGNGYALMNWDSNGVALFEELSGRVYNLRLDSTCTLTPADMKGDFGFIAKKMTSTAVLNGVENYADITHSSTIYGSGTDQTEDAVYFGALVGSSEGTIKYCKNVGDITITSTPEGGGDKRGITYIGGVVGKANGTLEDTTNSGDISYTITGRGGYLFMGGVAGGTTAVAIKADVTSYGTATRCVNTGNLYHTFDNQIIGSGNATSNYINLAGVVGYWIGSLEECVNGEKNNASVGKVQLVAPILETGEGYSAAGVSVAGVSCYAYDKALNCNNYGTIEVDGSFGPGYDTYPGGGNKEGGGTFIAGVVAQIGAFDTAVATHEITNCHNYGTMDINLPITSTSVSNYKSYHHVGGVIAYANATANNLSNNAAITIASQGTMNYLGGVIGQTDCDASNLTNNGDITFSISRTGGNQINNANQLFGGVIGYNTGDKLTNIVNNNPVSLTINNTNQKIRFGGVAGSMGNASGAENYGNVTLTDLVDHAKEIDFGGVAGASTSGTITNIKNCGNVEYTGKKMTGTVYIAGNIGYASSTSFERAYNHNPIKVTADEFGSLYAGGVTGSASGKMTDIANHEGITLDVPTIKTLYLAGISGAARSATEYRNCVNEGALSAKSGATLYLAGITGHSGGNVKFYYSTNSGNITYNAADLAATELNVAGICARPYAKSVYSKCENSGNISVTAKSASKNCYLGGIAAQTSNATSAGNSYDAEECKVTGDIYVDCQATWYVGGAIAYGSQYSSTTTNHRTASENVVEADITIASETTAHHVGGIIGHSGIHVDIADNSYTGTINVASNSDGNVGGIIGTILLKDANCEFAITGNTVNSTIQYGEKSYCGMLLGAVNNSGSKNTSVVTLEFDDNTIKSGSSINDTAITAENYTNYVMSAYDYTEKYTLEVSGIDTTIVE